MATETFWPEKTDDFLPYASDPHSYWTGYYTSRPSSKLFMRQGELWSQVGFFDLFLHIFGTIDIFFPDLQPDGGVEKY